MPLIVPLASARASASQRTSAKGTAYLTGWLGEAKLVGFKGEPDQYGNETWIVYAAEPPPRDQG